MKGNRGRRYWLSAALALMAAPIVGSGCGGGFDPISQVSTLRVLAVQADKPYGLAGEPVTFRMTVHDGYVNPDDPTAGPRPVQITWIGGCYNPPGDAYYGCYEQFQELFAEIAQGNIPQNAQLLQGIGFDTFQLDIPSDIVSSRPKPPSGPHYGIAYVFFTACAGRVGPVEDEGTGSAGSFPLGCFDDNGNRLGTESFVPGYTQVYVYEDGRQNQNPVAAGLTLDDEVIEETTTDFPEIDACPVSQDDRRGPPSCGKEDPYKTCTAYTIDVKVDDTIAELDGDSKDAEGNPLREVVWVDYFADKGTLDADVRLVNDATTGLTDEHSARYIAPPESGDVIIWAVLHDNRGGSTAIRRFLHVK